MGRFRQIPYGAVRRALALSAALAAPVCLGGCGGIEFQGKVFDYMGLSGINQPKADPKMAEHAPLILPPDLHSLPPPGEGTAAVTARADWPVDTDREQRRIVEDKQAEEKKQQALVEPGNPYAGKPTLLDKLFTRKKVNDDQIVDVPEPDPSDKTPDEKAREQKSIASTQLPPRPMVPDPVNKPPEEDPFHPSAPDSYKQMNSGNAAAAGY
ncbi:MAG TPA: hypothetical protein VG848_10415 [Acetobacteraceae bacterium]|nr:hypothetical protein [Acetobacteraceae bacterium]